MERDKKGIVCTDFQIGMSYIVLHLPPSSFTLSFFSLQELTRGATVRVLTEHVFQGNFLRFPLDEPVLQAVSAGQGRHHATG